MTIKKINLMLTALLTAFALTAPMIAAAQSTRFDFSNKVEFAEKWRFKGGLPGVRETSFRIEPVDGATNGCVLAIEADRATGTLFFVRREIDIHRTPYMHWRWRLIRPLQIKPGAAEPDDQAVVIYIGDGGIFRKRAIAYRWESRTPVGYSGRVRYAGGTVSISYLCLRNSDTEVGEWVEEERNVLEDYKAAFGRELNSVFALSVGANTQHTDVATRAEIDFIEFSSKPSLKEFGSDASGQQKE